MLKTCNVMVSRKFTKENKIVIFNKILGNGWLICHLLKRDSPGGKDSYFLLRLRAIARGNKPGSVGPAPSENVLLNYDPDEEEPTNCVIPRPRKEIPSGFVDLRNYKTLPPVLERNSTLSGYQSFKHSTLQCQPEVLHEMIEHDPDLSDEEKLSFIQDQKDLVTRRLKAEIDTKRERDRNAKEEEMIKLPLISEKTYKVRFPELAQDVVAVDIFDNHLRDELYIGYGWSSDEERVKDIRVKLQDFRNDTNNLKDQSVRAKEILALQRLDIATYRAPPRPDVVETFDAYLRQLHECALPKEFPPTHLPAPRVRRTIEEGSYPNWSVDEDKLPRALRFTWKGKLKKLREYLADEANHHKINKEDDRGRTALHYAASWGCLRTLKVLLQVPGIQLNKRDESGKTPLYKAVEINSIECVKALMDVGANPKITARDTRDPLTALMHFYGDSRLDMFKFLYEYGRYREDKVEPYFVTLLHKAVASESDVINMEMVKYLIEKGEDINAKEGKARTSLHLAVICGRGDIALLLLAHQINVFHIDDQYKTAIDYAERNTLIRHIIDEFYEYGPQNIDKVMKCRTSSEDFDVSKILRKPRRLA